MPCPFREVGCDDQGRKAWKCADCGGRLNYTPHDPAKLRGCFLVERAKMDGACPAGDRLAIWLRAFVLTRYTMALLFGKDDCGCDRRQQWLNILDVKGAAWIKKRVAMARYRWSRLTSHLWRPKPPVPPL